MIRATREHVGRRVIYVPLHETESTEYGTITQVGSDEPPTYVHVRYDDQHPGAPGKLTPAGMLIWAPDPDTQGEKVSPGEGAGGTNPEGCVTPGGGCASPPPPVSCCDWDHDAIDEGWTL